MPNPSVDPKQNLDAEVAANSPNNKSNTQTDKKNQSTSNQTSSTPKYTVTCNLISLTAGQDNPVNKLTSDLVGATLTITDPHTLVDTTKYPTSRYTLPTTFSTTISKVINNKVFEISPPYYVTDNDGKRTPVSLKAGSVSITYNTYKTITTDDTYRRSYANLTIGNLRTFSGDVYKAKIYTRDHGVAADYQKIYENYVIPENQLVDESSTTGYDNIGFFHTQSILDNNWVSSSTTTQVDPFVTLNDDKLIDGVEISGSVSGIDDRVIFRTKNANTLERNTDYVVRFNTYYYKSISKRKDSNNNIVDTNYASLKIYLSGSAITGQNGEEDFYVGKVNISDNDSTEGNIQNVIGEFRTAGSGSPKTWLKLQLDSGRFIVQDISIEPYSEINFNPSFFNALTPMPKPVKRDEKYDFLVEFYDSNNNLALTTAETLGTTFKGSNDVVGGLDNHLEGAVNWGGAMEAYGVSGNSAYLRTLNYKGFQNTLDNGLGGFMMFSGSIGTRITASEVSGYEYDGVGLEVVDGGATDGINRYLRFRTKPSIFEVVTDTFFFGQDPSVVHTGSFISGSQGNLQISSSNFSVDTAGNVTMSGFLSASGGHLGNFRIVNGKISGSNITMDANASTIYKTDQGPGSDTGAAFDQLRDEYYIDFTPAEETPNNYYIKFGPNFMVDKDGILIASGATFQGSITASAGLIGGFSIGSASLFSGLDEETPTFFFSGSANGSNFDKGNLFISSSGFQVNSQGAISASSGQIGGWDLTTTELQGTNAILKSSGVLSLGSGTDNYNQTNRIYIDGANTRMSMGTGFKYASNALTIDGSATIGGWTIDSNKISSNNLILHSDGFIETTDYTSDVKGFFLGAKPLADGSVGSFLEVDEARIRGTLKTTVFEKESVNAVGGQLWIANSTTITGSATMSATETTMSVANASGFTAGEIILLKKFNSTGFTTEYMRVSRSVQQDPGSDTNFSGSLFVERALGQSAASGTDSGSIGFSGSIGQQYTPGQVVVSTGKIGTGYIRLNANPNDQATPYIDIVERSGSGVYDIDLKTRLGDLSGLSTAQVGSNPGFGLYTEKLFLRASTASSASIAVGSATDATTGDGLYMDGSGVFRVGNPAGNQVYWNGFTLAITGDITVTNTGDFAPTNAEANPANYDFGPDATFDLNTVGTPSTNGLYLGSDKLGFYNSGWKTYMDSSGNFYLGGTAGALQWTGGSLTITGDITVTNTGDFAPTNAEANPSTYSFGPSADFTLTTFTPSTTGLYLGSSNMGYYDSSGGGSWKTYMDSSGNFYLGGTSGALQWSSGTLTITGNISFTNSPNISTFTNDEGFTDDTAADAAQATADGKPSVFRQTSQPSTSSPVGSLWYDTDDDNKLYVLVSGTPNVWTPTQDGDIATAQSAADAAQATADSRPKVFRQTSAPSTSEPGGSLWYDTDDDNKLYILVSSTWTPTRDGQITTALADAAAAQSTATTVSNDLQDVIDGVSVSGAGTFIDANVIYSPLIAGTNGYISNVFKVGNAGITLDGVNKKIYIGTGTYNNSNTAFYVDSSNNFSLGNKLSWNGSALSVTGTITATDITATTTGNIAGWSVSSDALTGGNVTLKSAGLMGISGSTTVGGSSVTTNILMNTDASKGSQIALQREDFGGDLTNFVELHASQSYFENNIGSYSSGSTRDNKDFTRDANDSETVFMSGTGAGAWGSNVYLRSDGSDLDDIIIESSISSGQLLDTGEVNLITEIQLKNLTEQAGAGTGKSLFRWKGEVFQNETNDTTGAELVGSFRISSLLSLSAAASALNISKKFLLTKRYFYVKITGTDYDVLTGSGVQSWTLGSSGTSSDIQIQGVKYLPRVITSGIGQQFFAGPNQEAKFGAKNEVIGDFKVKQTTAGTSGDLIAEGKMSVGTFDIDDTFDLFVDGAIGATGNIVGFYSSDKRLKENIVEIKDGLSLINQLRPVKFDWKQDSPFGHLKPTEYGLIAQEVQEVIPEIVGNMKDDYKGISYEKIVPLLISSIQQLTKRIEELEQDK